MASTSATLTREVPQVLLRNILVTTDFSEIAHKALWQGASIARIHQSSVLILHVVPPEPVVNSALEPASWEQQDVATKAKAEMEKVARNEALTGIKCEVMVVTGELTEVVPDIIRDRDISLVVVGTHGRSGMHKMLLGSLSEEIVRVAQCPVLTIGPGVDANALVHNRFESILFATDFEQGSAHALPYAIAFALETRARLILLHSIDEGSVNVSYLHEHLQSEARARLAEMLPGGSVSSFTTDVEVVSGYPVEEILRIARKNQCDLIVMGVHKSKGLGAHASAHLPWTIAHSVVCHAPCPVLTVRG